MFSIKVNPSSALGALNAFEQKQLPYAVSLALNRTANLAQQAERSLMRSVLRLRREEFNLRSIKIRREDRATKGSATVIIGIDSKADYLDRMEDGTPHIARGKYLFIPNQDVFGDKIVTPSNPLYPKRLQFVGPRMQGPSRTFLVKIKNNPKYSALVLQRVGGRQGGKTTKGRKRKHNASGRAQTRVVWFLRNRSQVPVKLRFVSTITGKASEVFPSELRAALGEALRSAR